MIFEPVTVSRELDASPSVVFNVLADPTQHLRIDGSGMLQAACSAPTRLQLDSRFAIKMRQSRLPYRVENTVTEYEEARLIAWRPWVRVAGRRIAGGVTWRYQLTPIPKGTRVSETYDVTTAWGARFLAALGYPTKMQHAMNATLLNLERLLLHSTVANDPDYVGPRHGGPFDEAR
ncbi:MAG TPA: SRPBCC family protein [Propionibacteriaceae bacterium]